MLYTSPWSRFELTTLVVICTDCKGSCKSNYHTITATTAPNQGKICSTCLNLVWFSFMVFNATFNNISDILWLSVLLVEETGVTGENHWPVASHCQSLSHNVVSYLSKTEGFTGQFIISDRAFLSQYVWYWKSIWKIAVSYDEHQLI
jgi:uncharacterized protein YjaG (DUF416 family)